MEKQKKNKPLNVGNIRLTTHQPYMEDITDILTPPPSQLPSVPASSPLTPSLSSQYISFYTVIDWILCFLSVCIFLLSIVSLCLKSEKKVQYYCANNYIWIYIWIIMVTAVIHFLLVIPIKNWTNVLNQIVIRTTKERTIDNQMFNSYMILIGVTFMVEMAILSSGSWAMSTCPCMVMGEENDSVCPELNIYIVTVMITVCTFAIYFGLTCVFYIYLLCNVYIRNKK